MARIKSTSPVGSPPRDVVADASILSRWMRAAAGDADAVRVIRHGQSGCGGARGGDRQIEGDARAETGDIGIGRTQSRDGAGDLAGAELNGGLGLQ